jgi:apolipoprotein N-acyltransferase
MIVPNRFDLWMACSAFAVLQTLIGLRFLARAFAREESSGKPGDWPAVRVFLPLAGEAGGLAGNIRRVTEQDYPGETRFTLVVPGKADAAYPAAAAAAAENPRVEVVATEVEPVGSSGKAADLAFAVKAGGPAAEVYAFTEADLEVPKNWLRELVAPLREGTADITTAAMVFRPAGFSVGGMLRSAWTAYGLPFFAAVGSVTGQSWAVRAEEFEKMDVAGLWGEVVSEDLAVAARARASGRRVRFVHGAICGATGSVSVGDAMEVFSKWIQSYRFYDFRSWTLGVAAVALKCAALCVAVVPPFDMRAAGTVLFADALLMAAALAAVRIRAPEALGGKAAAAVLASWALAPFLILAFAWNYAASVVSRDIVWGPKRYRLDGPRSVRVFERNAVPRGDDSISLPSAAGLSLWGAVCAVAFFPFDRGQGWLYWIAYAPLLLAVSRTGSRGAFFLGGAFGLGYWLFGMTWFFPTMRGFVGLPLPLVILAYGAMCAVLALMFAACAGFARWAVGRRPGGGAADDWKLGAVFLAALVVCERWYPKLMPVYGGNSQSYHLPAIQIVELGGLPLLSVILVGVSVAVFVWVNSIVRGRIRWEALAIAFAVLGANEAWGRARMRAVDGAVGRALEAGLSLRVAAIPSAIERQTGSGASVSPELRAGIVERTRRFLDRERADLLVWPDVEYGSLNLRYRLNRRRVSGAEIGGRPVEAALGESFSFGSPLVTTANGVAIVEKKGGAFARRKYRLALLAGGAGAFRGFAEKRYLIPFGHYVPGSRYFPFLRRLSPSSWGLSRGRYPRILRTGNGTRIGTLVCFDDMYAGWAHRLTRAGAELLVHSSNDAWFAGSGLGMHERWGVFRAVENRRFKITANNNGVSAIVDPVGRLVARSGPDRPEAISATVARLDIPVRGPRNGEWIAVFCALSCAGFAFARLLLDSTWGGC